MKQFLLLSMFKTVAMLNNFVETVIHFFFQSSKEQHLFEIEILYNTMYNSIIIF